MVEMYISTSIVLLIVSTSEHTIKKPHALFGVREIDV